MGKKRQGVVQAGRYYINRRRIEYAEDLAHDGEQQLILIHLAGGTTLEVRGKDAEDFFKEIGHAPP